MSKDDLSPRRRFIRWVIKVKGFEKELAKNLSKSTQTNGDGDSTISASIVEDKENGWSGSVVGVNAHNWESLKDRAFAGRDDGKWRVELDSSKSSIKPVEKFVVSLIYDKNVIIDKNEPELSKDSVLDSILLTE